MIDLRTASAEEIAEALLALDQERPGLAYDVGMALYQRGASKEVPGPPWDWQPERGAWIEIVGYTDRLKAMSHVRGRWTKSIDPVTFSQEPLSLQDVKALFDRVDAGEAVREPSGRTWSFYDPASQQVEIEGWAQHGVTVRIRSDVEIPKSHTRSLHDLSRGPIA